MDKLYSENALIRYIYKESDLFEHLEVEHALEYDQSIGELYLELCQLFEELPQVHFKPSQKSINCIMNAAL